jgi:uncharacterized protein
MIASQQNIYATGLKEIRQKLDDEGRDILRPVKEDEDPSEKITEHQQKIQPLFNELMNDILLEKKSRNEEQQAKWLLANMLDWYRREKEIFLVGIFQAFRIIG